MLEGVDNHYKNLQHNILMAYASYVSRKRKNYIRTKYHWERSDDDYNDLLLDAYKWNDKHATDETTFDYRFDMIDRYYGLEVAFILQSQKHVIYN